MDAVASKSVFFVISPHGIAMPKGLDFTGVFFLSFFRRLISEVTERISTKLGHIYSVYKLRRATCSVNPKSQLGFLDQSGVKLLSKGCGSPTYPMVNG